MGISESVLDVLVDIVLSSECEESARALQHFDVFVAALSEDSGMSEQEVQSILVARMLQDPGHEGMTSNVIHLDDFRHLLQVN